MGSGIWDLRFGVWNSGLRVPDFGFLVSGLGLGFGVWGLRFGIWVGGFRVWGFSFRVQGLGFLVEGLGLESESQVWGVKEAKHLRQTPVLYQSQIITSIAKIRFLQHMNCTFARTSIACCIEHTICVSEEVNTCPDLCYFKHTLYASNSIFTLLVRFASQKKRERLCCVPKSNCKPGGGRGTGVPRS